MNEENLNLNLGKVMALQKVRNKMLELSCKMDELGEPMLDDLSFLPTIYETYLEFFRKRGWQDKANKVYHRQKLILIVLYLYSPRTLAGGKMRIGLRDKLSELFGLSAKTTISDNSAHAVHFYQHYRDFRRDVDLMLTDIVNALGDNIIIKD